MLAKIRCKINVTFLWLQCVVQGLSCTCFSHGRNLLVPNKWLGSRPTNCFKVHVLRLKQTNKKKV